MSVANEHTYSIFKGSPTGTLIEGRPERGWKAPSPLETAEADEGDGEAELRCKVLATSVNWLE